MIIKFEGNDVVVYSNDGGRRAAWYIGQVPAMQIEHLERAFRRMHELGRNDKAHEILQAALATVPTRY